jgi:hypothetical protein
MDEVLCYVLHHYPSITLNNFCTGYKKGGLTYYQIECLFHNTMQQKDAEYRIIGAFHGISLSDDKVVPKDQLPEGVSDAKTFVFGDPDSYKKMSQEEKEKLTQEMMGNHKQWSSTGGIGSVKNV